MGWNKSITLSRFTKYKKIVWGHAVDEETIKYRLGMIMCLYALRMDKEYFRHFNQRKIKFSRNRKPK